MTALWAAYRNEWSKLMRRKKYIVFLFIGLAFIALWTALDQLITGLMGRQSFTGFSLTSLLPSGPMGILSFFLRILIPFLMFMGVTDLLTVEGAENTMKAMLSRPVERWKLYAAKILAVVTYAALYLAGIFVFSSILNQIFGRALSIGELLISLASYALTLVPLAILASFAALIALLCKSGSLTMFLLLLIYLILSLLPIIFPVMTEMLFTSYLGWYRLWIGALPSPSKLIHMLLIVLGYGTAFFTAGSLVFDRKEY
ncbi:MAG: ABC transporter permease [Oscillospiraceae bacterium]|nr:ABC transporter permease [Oscillospiraceae bacterium]